jgi:hypothetical protein
MMKPRIIRILIFVMVITFAFTLAVSAQESSTSSNFLASPTPTTSHLPYQIPFIPFKSRETFPAYLSKSQQMNPRSAVLLTKPTGIDLDVTYINRSPMYNRYNVLYTADGKPYLNPGTDTDKRWPSPGELVTFTAHIFNKGTIASGSFSFKWYVDGLEVQSGTHTSLNPGQEGTASYQWAWANTLNGEQVSGSHSIRFTADPANAIAETYELNNSLEDSTDALSLFLALTPDLYTALETPVNSSLPFSAEDWLQKQISAMNAAFIRSVYPSTPNGITERVRLDKIIITSTSPSTDYTEDGQFFLSSDDRYGDGYYDPATDVSGALLHELTHQLGIIDMYNLDVSLEIPQVLDRMAQPVQMEFSSGYLFPGLMNNPGIKPPIYDEHTALALNANKGYRRGYYGEYLYDIPGQTNLRVLDNQGNPASNVTVNLFQRSSSPNLYGSKFGTIDNTPEISGVTDAAGLVLLPNRSVGTPTSTNTGHTLSANPFGTIDVVGKNDEFILELTKGTHQEFAWFDITRLNLAAWQGGRTSATIDISAHIPPVNAPASPVNLSGILENGLVKLQWSASPTAGVAGYNVYRASDPINIYTPIATGLTSLNYSPSYDYGSRAAQYVVTAVDALGHESGFSNIFYALRLSNPASIAVDGLNRRIVLDPQNGYALLYQLPDGSLVDTRGSYDLHLEYSFYLVSDLQGCLIISHPGDYYTSRQSVRVTDQDGNPLLEFGDTGSGLGQFQTPTGVALWRQPCASNPCRFLVADSGNNRIQAFDANGNFVSAYGVPGNGNGQFNNPQGLAITNSGNIIIADSGNNRLQVLSFDGKNFNFVRVITASLNHPTGLAAFEDSILVADTGNSTIKVLNSQGNITAAYTAPTDGRTGTFNQPRGIAVDNDGSIVVADTGNKRVVTILNALPIWKIYLPIVNR